MSPAESLRALETNLEVLLSALGNAPAAERNVSPVSRGAWGSGTDVRAA